MRDDSLMETKCVALNGPPAVPELRCSRADKKTIRNNDTHLARTFFL